MKRLERLGSAAFLTVTISLVFHILAMSYKNLSYSKCTAGETCDGTTPVQSWTTSLLQRCYQAPAEALFASYNRSIPIALQNTFTIDLCIPNQFLMVKDSNYAYECLLEGIAHSHMVCVLKQYDQNHCKCDYTTRTKASTATSILVALALGVMLFLSHLVSFVKIDYVLRWLIPLCFGLLSFSILFIIVTLSIISSKLNEDIEELIYRSSLVNAAIKNVSLIDSWKATIATYNMDTYVAKFGYCFGLEILALHFTVVSLVLYALMFTAKKRPESISHK